MREVTFTVDMPYPSGPDETTVYRADATYKVTNEVAAYAHDRRAIRPLPAPTPASKPARTQSRGGSAKAPAAVAPPTPETPDPAEPAPDAGG